MSVHASYERFPDCSSVAQINSTDPITNVTDPRFHGGLGIGNLTIHSILF